MPIWKRRRFKLYRDRISYWDVNAHSDDIPKYSMRLDDVTDLKSLKPEANMSRFEIQARLSKDSTLSWIIGCTDERICSLWMSAIRIQKQRLELRARIKKENEKSVSSSSQSSGDGESRSSSTPVHFLKTVVKVSMNMLHRWWERIPNHDEIIHRKIARSQIQTDSQMRSRSSSVDSEIDSDNDDSEIVSKVLILFLPCLKPHLNYFYLPVYRLFFNLFHLPTQWTAYNTRLTAIDNTRLDHRQHQIDH